MRGGCRGNVRAMPRRLKNPGHSSRRLPAPYARSSFLSRDERWPALLLNDPKFPLIRIVCEGNGAFDLVYFTLSLVPRKQLVAWGHCDIR
jgi:hypothetical protein